MTPAVETRDLCWGPPQQPDILTRIDFNVPRGQIVAIFGANKSGKSSLLRLIYRHPAPRRGWVRRLGRDLWQTQTRQDACNLAAVLQEQPADFALTVRQIVTLGRAPTGGATEVDGRVSADTMSLVVAMLSATAAMAEPVTVESCGRPPAFDTPCRTASPCARGCWS